MSGGHFDCKQYNINEIADSILSTLDRQGDDLPKSELFYNDFHYKKYPEERCYRIYPAEIQQKMNEAVKYLRIAAVYAQRIDWFLSGDDGEESFLKRLEEDLKELGYG